MLTNFEEYLNLSKGLDFSLLLDVAHLKVSSNSLNLNYKEEFQKMIQSAQYVHVSDNDSFHDLNWKLTKDSDLVRMLAEEDLINKIFTLEVYDGMEDIKKSYEILKGITND